MKNCKSFIILLIMDANQILSDGNSIIELLTAVLRKFSKDGQIAEVLKNYIAPYFVNFQAIGSKKLLNEKLNYLKYQFQAQYD